ncbi:MAG: universal stress protein, partial [Acetobacterium sp.]|nr:universal stress protein [Acetobacterium sp.]
RSLGTKECLLLQCFNPQDVDAGVSSYLTAIFNENLQQQSDLLMEQGFAVKTKVVSGNIKNEVNRVALEEECSLIVVGAEKHSMIGGLFLGGIAYDVIYGSTKPILLVRDALRDEHEALTLATNDGIEHVLFPTDFSENADIAFTYIKELVKNGVKQVTIFHIQDESKINPYLLHRLIEFNEIDQGRLEKLKEDLLSLNDINVDIQIRFGSPTAEILKIVDEQQIQLVVMGTQGRGFISEIFMGSVSHNIVRHSSSSVLLIPGIRE